MLGVFNLTDKQANAVLGKLITIKGSSKCTHHTSWTWQHIFKVLIKSGVLKFCMNTKSS